jgi:hypothetical protein
VNTSIYDQPIDPGAAFRKRLYCDCPAEQVAFILTLLDRDVRVCADHVEAIARLLDVPWGTLRLI